MCAHACSLKPVLQGQSNNDAGTGSPRHFPACVWAWGGEEEVGPRSNGRVEGERHARIQGPELQWGILRGCGTERIQHQCSMTVDAIRSLEVVSF